MRYNFDKFIDRTRTNSLKYDFASRRGMPDGLIPMWVADMDFKAPKEVIKALTKQAKHGIYGYSEPYDEYFNIFETWAISRFGWTPKREWHLNTPGIVFAIATAIKAYTKEGEAVMISPPVYYPFRLMTVANGRKLVNSPLVQDAASGRYAFDFDDFERKIVDNNVKLYLLCSPHNPVGRVWEEDELRRVGEICLRHNVIVLADEIHANFVYSGYNHRVFSDISEDFLKNTVVCHSPGKTFNLAGLQFSDIFIADENLRNLFKREIDKSGYSQLNTFGIVAAEAAYRYGAAWLDELLTYLEGNADFIADFVRKNLPQVKFLKPEGTYLAWLDFRSLGLNQKELERFAVEKAKLWLDSGTIFGEEGEGFLRVNFACSRKVLQEAMENIKRAMTTDN